MEIGLQKTETVYYRKRENSGVTFEAESDMVVPDVMPDIGEIVYSSGTALLRSKTLSDGRLTVSGSIQSQILYVPESEGDVKKLELEIPFSYAANAEAAADCLIAAVVRVAYVDAHAVNPRKLGVRCELCAELSMYEAAKLVVGAHMQPGFESDICVKQESITADMVSGIYEKSFIVTDSYPLSAAQGEVCELLTRNVNIFGEEVKYVGTKMILKGTVQTDLVWRSDEELCTSSFSSGFSQIMEIGELEQPSADVSLLLTGAYFELSSPANSSRTVTAELHVLAQVVCSQRKTITYISDVYSNRFPIQASYDEPKTLSICEYEIRKDSMRGVLDTPWPVREIISVKEAAALWSPAENGFSCPINLRLLLRDEDGCLHGLVRSFTAKWESPPISGGSEMLRSVTCEELTANPTTDGVEIRMLAAAKVLRSSCTQITSLESVEADDTARIDLTAFPSVTVLPSADGDLWALAKRYHSTVDLIEEVNRGNDSSVLLIQRAR